MPFSASHVRSFSKDYSDNLIALYSRAEHSKTCCSSVYCCSTICCSSIDCSSIYCSTIYCSTIYCSTIYCPSPSLGGPNSLEPRRCLVFLSLFFGVFFLTKLEDFMGEVFVDVTSDTKRVVAEFSIVG